jgi:hypothetical protein
VVSDLARRRFFFLINFSERVWKVGTDPSGIALTFLPLTSGFVLLYFATFVFLIGIKLVTFT